jgi:hypothetical protein
MHILIGLALMAGIVSLLLVGIISVSRDLSTTSALGQPLMPTEETTHKNHELERETSPSVSS